MWRCVSVSVCGLWVTWFRKKVNYNPAQTDEADTRTDAGSSLWNREEEWSSQSDIREPRAEASRTFVRQTRAAIYNNETCNSMHQLPRIEFATSRGFCKSIDQLFYVLWVFFFVCFSGGQFLISPNRKSLFTATSFTAFNRTGCRESFCIITGVSGIYKIQWSALWDV